MGEYFEQSNGNRRPELTGEMERISDLTPIPETLSALKKSEEKFRTLFESIDEGYLLANLIYDENHIPIDVILLEANSAFEVVTGLKDVIGKSVKKILPGIEDYWISTGDEVVRTGNAIRYAGFVKDLNKWLDVHFCRIGISSDQTIAVLINDITESKLTEELLIKAKEEKAFLLKLSDAIRALEDPVKIQEKAATLLGRVLGANRTLYTEINGNGLVIHQDYTDGVPSIAGVYPQMTLAPDEFHEVVKKGEAFIVEDIWTDSRLSEAQRKRFEFLNMNAFIIVGLIKNGNLFAGLAVHSLSPRQWRPEEISLVRETAERTWASVERARAEAELINSKEKYLFNLENEVHQRTSELNYTKEQFSSLVENTPDIISRWDKRLKLIYVNNAFEYKSGFSGSSAIGKDFMEIGFPLEISKPYMEILKKVFDNRIPLEHYNTIDTPEGGRHFFSRMVPEFNDRGEVETVLAIARDITDLRNAQREITESASLLQSIFDTSLVQMSVMRSVRHESGELADFLIMVANKEFEKDSGVKEIIGKKFSNIFPQLFSSTLFDAMKDVVSSGIPRQVEYQPFEEKNKWFSCMFVKFEDGLVSTNIDITNRKIAEEQRFRNFILLQQAEELSKMGSWEFDLQNQRMTWSGGMYKLFGMNEGEKVSPEIYRSFATKDYKITANRVIREILSGKDPFEETMEIMVNEKQKYLKLKATIIYDKSGLPVRILGVDADITAIRDAENKNRELQHKWRKMNEQRQEEVMELKLQQQREVLNVILTTQEQERERIGEALHNGVAQLLYGIQTRMQLLNPQSETESKLIFDVLQITRDAINDIRKLSFELVPVVLKDFGIEVALKALFERIFTGVPQFDLKLKGLTGRLSDPVEFAIYRIVQELVNNILKHSNATKAKVEISQVGNKLKLVVSDNGVGIKVSNNILQKGIGLQSVKNRVRLLGGSMIFTPVKTGTTVKISLSL